MAQGLHRIDGGVGRWHSSHRAGLPDRQQQSFGSAHSPFQDERTVKTQVQHPEFERPETRLSDAVRAELTPRVETADSARRPLPADPPAANPPPADSPKIGAPRVEPPTPADVSHVSDNQMRSILDMSKMLSVPTDLDTMLCRLAETCTQLLDCERASIFLYDGTTKELWTKVALGSNEIRLPAAAGVVGAAFNGNCVIHVADPYLDPRFSRDTDLKTGYRTRNLMSAPLADLVGQPMGVIQAVNKKGRGGFGEQDESLIRLMSEQAGVAIQRHRLQLQAMEAVALKHEMDLARRTQQALIPKHSPTVPGLTCSGWTLPASVTGGDCFDLWTLPDGRLGVLVADASGHGLGPALVVSQARAMVRSLSDAVGDPHAVLARVNARLAEDLDWGQFVTAFLGFLSPDGLLHWSSAGHGPTLFRRSLADPLEDIDPPVQPLGVLSEWFDGPSPPIQLEPGGQLILSTDGIFEAARDDGEQLGVERMRGIVDRNRHEPPEGLLAALRSAAREWSGRQEPLDDQTLVIVQREAGPDPDPA